MGIWLSEALRSRYVKLTFKAEMLEDTMLPVYKCSALRGGMGQMLMDTNCIMTPQGDCKQCCFPDECLVQRVLYSHMETQLNFMSSGSSVGYVLECGNYWEQFHAGDELAFSLILFGKNVMYFSQYLNAFFMLGGRGIGRERSRFQVTEIVNAQGKRIYDGRRVHIENYDVRSLEQYVIDRMGRMKDWLNRQQENGASDRIRLKFKTPLDMKWEGQKLDDFQGQALMVGIARRLRMLSAFEGRDIGMPLLTPETIPALTGRQIRHCSVPRYSFRKEQKVWMKGIEGEADISSAVDDNILKLLLAGELIHIGSNTSYGFGHYRMSFQ